MYTKYEVSMSNAVPGEVCTDDDDNILTSTTMHNGQFMTV